MPTTSPTTITVSPELAAVIADALDIAARRTAQDGRDHSARVAAAHSRVTRGEEPHALDAGTIEAAESVRIGIESLQAAQEYARDLFDAMHPDLDPVQSARDWH
jgi:hypothetical protein